MQSAPMQFADLMRLEPHGPDTFVGAGPLYPWHHLYGGQIVAQSLKAAAASVNPEHRVHSLHAYFIRLGKHDAPVRFEVDRIRDGRTFTTRRVVARQSAGAILNLSCSFSLPEGEAEEQTLPMPAVARAEEVAKNSGWIELLDRRDVITTRAGRRAAWFRPTAPFGDDPTDHACALAYFSDDFPCEAVALKHPEWTESYDKLWMTSLDHSIWFHHSPRADRWMLHDFHCERLVGTHGLASGHVFAEDGTLLATVSQEVLLRRKR